MFDRYYIDADYYDKVRSSLYAATSSIWHDLAEDSAVAPLNRDGSRRVAQADIDRALEDYFGVKDVDELVSNLYSAGVDFDDDSLLADYDTILAAIVSHIPDVEPELELSPDEYPTFVLPEWR